ncbi:putative mediator of RNA polymerase II transcription subunit 24 [Apostichopus japonicus]|uniref:Mediator of RNA polymerase II transcription subunit 24 n=1 Tax=Stichopus japonicus TaxID=307972 RepID=A0A2G8LRZ9_STIJA|nr:putative mediator of RNA polymerase II transcription subunit 24 [Apostichopus japonicus]
MDAQQTYTAVQELLLRAWKERLPDIQWSIQMKRVLKGATIDGYTLCVRCLLVPTLPLYYLLLEALHLPKMVSHVAVLRSLAKYENTCVTRPFCMKSLLEILKLCVVKISCLGPPDECLQIAVALLQVILWLVKSICLSLEKIAENGSSIQIVTNLMQMCELLYGICAQDQTRMLLYIARLEDEALWSQLEGEIASVSTIVNNAHASGTNRGNHLEQALNSNRQQPSPQRKDGKERTVNETLKFKLERALDSALKVPNCSYSGKYLPTTHSMEYYTGYVNCYVNIMTFIETHLTITHDPQLFVDQILLYEKLQNLSRKQLYTSLCQGALLGLVDSSDDTDQIRSFAFLFLKLPKILSYLHHNVSSIDPNSSALYHGLDNLLQYVSLIDSADTKHKCDCFQQFLSQLVKLELLNETQATELMAKRQASRHSPADTTPQQHLVIQANSTLPTILDSLEVPDKSVLDEMPNVFHPLMNSFQLVAATSAATNKLKTFSSKLISFNELTKATVIDGSKGSHVQAALYDISFLMLCLISQQYGIELVNTGQFQADSLGRSSLGYQCHFTQQMVLNNDEESFFERWAQQCLPDELGAKPMYLPLAQTEQMKIDQLVQLFYTSGDIKAIKLQGICSEMFSLGVCAAAWLHSNAVGVDASGDSKVWAFFEMFLEPKPSQKVDFHFNNTERIAMMTSVIEKMKSHSSGTSEKAQEYGSNPSLASKDPSTFLFSSAFQEIMVRKVLFKRLQPQLEMMFNMSGVTWICWSVISEVLKLNRRDDLALAGGQRATHHRSPEKSPAPTTLRSQPQQQHHRPRGRALAKLTVWCIASTLTTQNSYRADPKAKENPMRIRKRKRTRGEPDRDSTSTLREDNRPSKLRRLLSIPEDENAASGLNSTTLSTTSNPLLVPQTSTQLGEPLYKAIASMMQLFASVLSENALSSRTEFIYSFLQEILTCGDAVSSTVLQFMPVSMANHLFSTINKNFIQDLALAIETLDSVVARRQAARALCIMGR